MPNEMNQFNGKDPVRKPVTAEEFNNLVFETIGLDVNEEGYIFDDDLGILILLKGKYLVLDPNLPLVRKDVIYFDPAHNPSIMDKLFKHFLAKHDAETGVDTKFIAFSGSSYKERSYLEVAKVDGTKYRSRNFYNDNIKCADIILNMNSDLARMYDLSKLDTELMEYFKERTGKKPPKIRRYKKKSEVV